ncbi:hypothetical protein HAX54_039627, partial [Datura stramonium]|nr:hypothetical protein [Datura stramonium]
WQLKKKENNIAPMHAFVVNDIFEWEIEEEVVGDLWPMFFGKVKNSRRFIMCVRR